MGKILSTDEQGYIRDYEINFDELVKAGYLGKVEGGRTTFTEAEIQGMQNSKILSQPYQHKIEGFWSSEDEEKTFRRYQDTIREIIKYTQELYNLQLKLRAAQKAGDDAEIARLEAEIAKKKELFDLEKKLKSARADEEAIAGASPGTFNNLKKKHLTLDEQLELEAKAEDERNTRIAEKDRKDAAKQMEALYRNRANILAKLYSNELNTKVSIDPLEKSALREQREYLNYDLNNITEQIDLFKNKVHPDDLARIKETTDILTGHKFADADVRFRGKSNFWGSLSMNLTRMFDRFVKWGAVSKVFQTIRRDIQKLIQAAAQLDKAMTNLRIVTGYNEAQAETLIDNYAKLGAQIGSTATEVATSANEWLRQGYAMNEVNELVTASMYLSKLGMISVEDATKNLRNI